MSSYKKLTDTLDQLFDKENELLDRLKIRESELLGSDEIWKTLTQAHKLLKKHIEIVVKEIDD